MNIAVFAARDFIPPTASPLSDMDVELILRHAKTPEEKLLGRRLLDLAERCERIGWYTCTDFLSPAEQAFCGSVLTRTGLKYVLDGGYDGAERACVVFCPDYCDDYPTEREDRPVAAVRVTHSTPLTHRDFLGSVLGLGLERDAVGDILVGEKSTVILMTSDILPFVLTNLSSVGRVGVRVDQLPLTDIAPPEVRFETVKDTVASLRLDCVVASAFRLSREAAQKAIAVGLVRQNHLEQTSPSASVAQGDVLALRGRGKAQLDEVGGESRKGRIWISIKKFI